MVPPKEGEDVDNKQIQPSAQSNIDIIVEEPAAPDHNSDSNSITSENPGYALFDPDTDEEQDTAPDEPILNNETASELENFLISPNDNPLPISPHRGRLNSESNWLQSSTDSNVDTDNDQFLLNANDLHSDDAWSPYSDSNSTINEDEFEFNDQYIDDDLEHYFLDPEGLNLMNPFGMPNGGIDEEDPEPPPGPVDPG